MSLVCCKIDASDMNSVKTIDELYHIIINHYLSNIIKIFIYHARLIMNSPDENNDD